MRRQVLDHHPGHDQEAAVADDARQLLAALAVTPAQPVIARRKPPRRGAHRQATDHAQPAAHDQVAKLGPAQRAAALRMPGLHQPIPVPALGRAAHHHLKLDPLQIAKLAAELHRRRHRALPRLPRHRPRRRQHHCTAALQTCQLLAARHLLQPAHPVAPTKSLARLPRQPIARHPLCRAHPLADPRQSCCRTQLGSRRRNPHPSRLPRWKCCVQRYLWVMIRSCGGGGSVLRGRRGLADLPVMTPPSRITATPPPEDAGLSHVAFFASPVCGGRWPEGPEGGHATAIPSRRGHEHEDPHPALRATFPRRRGKA